jgi:predicted GH43/DUF377 family glycosyl hydrolase
MNPVQMRRLGQIMAPQPGSPMEAEGVLNPAAVRGPDGDLYLFPRLVARGNYSRIGIARVRFDGAGEPSAVQRLGIALEPEAAYELRPGGGGCEDPRVAFVQPLGRYIMTYTAFTANGPRIALAASEDLLDWQRLGLVTFEPHEGVELDDVDNKDASVFPIAIPDPSGQPALALLHRPLFPGTSPEDRLGTAVSGPPDPHRESIWISYRSMAVSGGVPEHLCHFTSHHRLAFPQASWERLKIGGGAPPVLTRHGWLIIYHGVSASLQPAAEHSRLRYSAGMMMLSAEHPHTISYRSAEPILAPVLPEERRGTISDVVFPTGIDRRDNLGQPDRFDIYYGMADRLIGVARLDLPDTLPAQPEGEGMASAADLAVST